MALNEKPPHYLYCRACGRRTECGKPYCAEHVEKCRYVRQLQKHPDYRAGDYEEDE